jgi:hypothetical protein
MTFTWKHNLLVIAFIINHYAIDFNWLNFDTNIHFTTPLMGIAHNYLASNNYFVHSWLGFQKKEKNILAPF